MQPHDRPGTSEASFRKSLDDYADIRWLDAARGPQVHELGSDILHGVEENTFTCPHIECHSFRWDFRWRCAYG